MVYVEWDVSREKVAPLAGAWVEICHVRNVRLMPLVAPLAGAWVEIVSAAGRGYKEIVAPLAGAWVEIAWKELTEKAEQLSLPSRERGLKLDLIELEPTEALSLPSRERGLKFLLPEAPLSRWLSLPSRERGLKSVISNGNYIDPKSLPSRERGLKYGMAVISLWIDPVAPLAGAWVEISSQKEDNHSPSGRSPRGSVG